MLISCEQCSTTYTLDDCLIVPGGIPVQCTHCGHIFMAIPSGDEAQALDSPLSQASSAYGAEGKIPSLGSTQIFGVSSEEMSLASASALLPPAAGSLEYGHAAEPPSNEQPGAESLQENEADEVAYFDFESTRSEDPLNDNFKLISSPSQPESPAANPPASPVVASRRISVSVRQTPLLVPEEPEAAPPHWVEEDEAPAEQRLEADLPDHIADEIRRVEDEQAARLHRFHQSEQFLTPTNKMRRLVVFFLVVFLLLVLAAVGVWLVLGYPPQQRLSQVQGHVLPLKPSGL